MPLCSHCNESLLSSRIQDSSLILEKLRWESGPASIPNTEDILPILQNAERELEDCERQIKALELRRQSLREYTGQLQSLLSPFRKVPDEILWRVFDECCIMNHFGDAKTRGAITDLPALVVSSVCSRWRRNGLSMPSLWSRISLVCQPMGRNDGDEELLSALESFLSRAGQHPLTVTINLAEDFINRHPGLTRLINLMDRWRSFTYRSKAYSLFSLFSNHGGLLTSPSFLLLEELVIPKASHMDLDVFAIAPKLRKLSIGDIPNLSLPKLHLYVQLSHFEFYFPFRHEIQTLVDSSHHFVSLKTEESVHKSYTAKDDSPICYTIKTLTLCHDPIRWRGFSVLPYLTLPSLKVIHLERNAYHRRKVTPDIHQRDWRNFDPFMAFLSRSSCSLTTLSIQSLGLTDMKLLELLTLLPTLLHLCIDDSYVLPEASPLTDQFINSLHVHHPSSPIVPRLHSLTLNLGTRTFEDASVVDMVRSRWIPSMIHANGDSNHGVDCLREFTIRFRNRKEVKGVYQPLEDMEKDGLRAVVLWQNEGSQLEE